MKNFRDRSRTEAYKEGALASSNKKSTNPYNQGTEEYDLWEEGLSDKETRAYKQGYAYCPGDINPYSPETKEWCLWRLGYDAHQGQIMLDYC